MAQVTISIAASGDDTNLYRVGTAYPPVTTDGGQQATNQFIPPYKEFSTPNYTTEIQFVRFDTSIIPDDATITAATLLLWFVSFTNPDTRNVNFEWYSWTPPPAHPGDWAETVGTTANVTALSAYPGSAQNVDHVLSNPAANINTTGFTGIRMGISGGVPTATNKVFFRSWDHATDVEPRLQVTYTPFQGTATAAWLTA